MNKKLFNFKKPYLIAEISTNHCGSLVHAKKLIRTAKKYGADAVKLQTYTADTMTINSKKKYFKIKEGLWKGYNLYKLYDEAHTPLQWHKDLFSLAKQLDITIFSTPFDESSVDFLEKYNCPIYKIASFEMTDIPLIKKIASKKKPLIISTGMASLSEIETTFNIAKKHGAKDITLLYCVSKYPSNSSDFNMNNIKILKDKFKCRIGFSDHSNDIKIACAAVAAGADVIEKHIALDGQKKGLDIDFSLKGREIKKFREEIDNTFKLLGKNYFHREKSESKSKVFRRSIFAVKNIKKGDKFTIKNIRRIRPGYGIAPIFFEKLLDKRSPINISAEQPIPKKIIEKLKL